MSILKKIFLVPLLFAFQLLAAQNYQAIHGSSFAGSLAPGNNPASIVHVPYAWDITPFAIQAKQSTNAFKVEHYSLLSSPNNITVSAQNGTKNRFLAANQNIRLLNTRLSLNAKAAIAFGANVRNYVYAAASKTNWQDTLYTLYDFLTLNTSHLPLSVSVTGTAWAEFYAGYAQTIAEDEASILNAGVTLKLNRSVAGAYAVTSGLNYVSSFAGNKPVYDLTGGRLQYGYSDNFDKIDSNHSAAANRKRFLQKTALSMGADIGLEYILLTDEDRPEGGDYAYETKIGISVMDIGYNKYRHGSNSRLAIAEQKGINDTLIENKFSAIENSTDFNDSLASITGSFAKINGDFYIYQPTRLVINVDKHLLHNFFINAELTLPLGNILSENSLFIKDINLLAITPRWELKYLGAYLPLLYNNRNQLWIGGAFKAGPILLGTHNLANLFAKDKIQSGGIYLAVTVRPGRVYDRYAHYPKEKTEKKGGRQALCPRL
jgi:hypothetical protein